MSDFIIVAPPYTRRSNGIHTLYKLCDAINRRSDHSARIAILDKQGVRAMRVEEDVDHLIAPSLQRGAKIGNAIVVYPEIVTKNILGADRVVWYLLNRDGLLSGRKIQAAPGDYWIAHSRVFRDPRVQYVLYSCDPDPAFHAIGSLPWVNRPLNLTYIGKGAAYGPCHRVSNSIVLGHSWPESHEQLAELLRASLYLYTWDAWTMLTTEATLCGAMPIVMRWDPWTPEDMREDEIAPLVYARGRLAPAQFEAQREAFVARVEVMRDSWQDRVGKFVDLAAAHFEGVR